MDKRWLIFDGIKTGDNVRIPLRNRHELKNSPQKGFSVLISDGEREGKGIITNTYLDEQNVLDLSIISYLKIGWQPNDGQIRLMVIYRNHKA